MDVPASDAAAVRAARSGDRDAFGELVERYQEIAFRVAYLVVRDGAVAEDVAQEAFIRAFRHLDTFSIGEPFRPWLLRIVTNVALNELRARGRRRSLWERVTRTPRYTEPGPERAVEANEQRELVTAAINELRPEDRLVLYLRYFVELPESEIATAIGKRPGTVKSRLHRANARLREVIERRYPALRPETATREGAS